MVQGTISALRPHGSPRLYRKGTTIFFQGEVPRSAIVILNGSVRAYNITSGGEERTVALYTTGDVLPLAWVLGNAPTSFLHYEAFSDVRVIEIKKTSFQAALSADHTLALSLVRHTSDNYAALLLRVIGLGQSRAIEKIAYTLYYLAFRHGIEKQDGTHELDLKLSQTIIASLIGQTRESTARNIKVLKDSGIINYSGTTYTVDKIRLENFIGEDSFRDIISE